MSDKNIIIDTSELAPFPEGQSSSDFTVTLANPHRLSSRLFTVRLKAIHTWYSFHNISSTYRNNVFTVWSSGGSVDTLVTIPNGIYSFETFEEEFTRQVEAAIGAGNSPVAFTVNTATGKFTCTVSGASNSVVFHMESAIMFGFVDPETPVPSVSDYTVYEGTPVSSTYAPRWNNGINSLSLDCDLTSDSSVNGRSCGVLETFTPENGPYEKMSIQFTEPSRLQVNKDLVSSIRIKLTDQSGNVINLNGEHMVVHLVLSPI